MGAMEWLTTQHLDLQMVRGPSSGSPQQAQCAAFHPSQALFAAAVGQHIAEFDALTGCKLSSIDIGAGVMRMAYSPAGGHILIAVLEDWTIKSWDLDTEHTHVLYSPERRSGVSSANVEVHIALTPLRPWLFFGAHLRLSVNVVGTVEGVKAATKIKTDLKKPITELACHPRSPLLFVAYSEGLIRAYHIQTFTVQYTLQIDSSIKLVGAGAFAFHSTLEWVFVGDRSGTLLAWDVSVATQPTMIGITQVGSNPITALAWHSMLRLVVSLSKDGSVHVWRARVILNPNRPPMRANFFESAGVEEMDVASILTQCGGQAVYPLPRIKDLLLHPKLNMATMLFANVSGSEDSRKSTTTVSREARRQLFSVLQSARGSPGSVLKEKLAVLGSAGILPDHQLHVQMQQSRALSGQGHLTISDLARKAFLYGKIRDGQGKQSIVLRLPLLTIADPGHHLRDIPVCQPIQQEINFFNSEQGIFNYPVRAFFMDGCNLTAYNLSTGDYNIYKKLSPTALGGHERSPKNILYSVKQHLFLIFFECRSSTNEVVLYREPFGSEIVGERVNTLTGCDGAFVGPNESQYVILDEDKIGLTLYNIEEDATATQEVQLSSKNVANGAIDLSTFSDTNQALKPQANEGGHKGTIQYVFDNPVQRIFTSPLESLLMYVFAGSHIGLVRLNKSQYTSLGDSGNVLSTDDIHSPSLRLQAQENVLQVRWQDTPSGPVAGILTTHRVMIASKDLEILSVSSELFDKGLPSFRSLVWVGPALLFSTATAVAVLGWHGLASRILTIATPNSALVGALNDRLLLACTTDVNPRQKQTVEIKTRLLGLLEPLLIGWTSMQLVLQPKVELEEILYRLTSRFDSLRITPHSLDILANGPSVCGDLAVELAQAGPQFTQELRCKYATQARRWAIALSILKDEFLRSRDYPRCPQTSRLFQRFRELGQACIKYGQFDSAKESFEVVSDFQSMLDLFICHLNPSALRRLTQKLEEVSCDPDLRRQCEKILLVRSAGWGQGAVFANFAAESMAPKGPEWAGGNWEVKTFPEVKVAPEWVLSGEVTAYMKTASGAIPTIIPDHIGVYLGTLKGRGTVVEVRDDALIKRITSGDVGSLTDSLDKKAPALKGTSLADKMSADDDHNDEQAKAAEEFKKGIYGMDGSTSEDDDGSINKKKIKIRIRDKPSTTAVDVDKVKEATKQFRLPSDGGGRARFASNGSQEISLGSFESTPSMQGATVSSTVGASMMTGMGVSGGPIPEEFFQGTSFIANTPLQSPLQPGADGGYPQTLISAAWPSVNVPVATHGASVSTSATPIFSDPFAPQAVQDPSLVQSFPTLQPTPQPSISDISLPDGGIPPQYASQEPNLGSFESTTGPPSNTSVGPAVTSSKPLSQPHQPALRPGQVPHGAPASKCFEAARNHLEQNQLKDALSCLDESFLALAKDRSLGIDIRTQAKICAQYKIAVLILQEITKLQKIDGAGSVAAKEEMARLARHLSTLPLLAKHRMSCIRTAIKRNMDVQNYGFAKSLLDLLLSKAPANKQDELKALINVCTQRGLSNRTIDDTEDASQFCSATLARLPTIGHDICDLCGSKFSALSTPGCTVCGMGTLVRSDAASGSLASPFA